MRIKSNRTIAVNTIDNEDARLNILQDEPGVAIRGTTVNQDGNVFNHALHTLMTVNRGFLVLIRSVAVLLQRQILPFMDMPKMGLQRIK